jgi:SAM-dependent methyltransferase
LEATVARVVGSGVPSQQELLDQSGVPPADVERALRDLATVSRWMLAGAGLRRMVLGAVAGAPNAWCLDLGAGGGHFAAELERAAGRRGSTLRVLGVDRKLAHLVAGRRLGSPQRAVVADASALPLRAAAVACAFSHLFFHHFDDAGNRVVLAEMRRVARVAVVVDLRRSALARALVRPFLRLLRLSPIAYHDGVLSVRRSYGLAAVRAVTAGLPVRELRRRFPLRWSLVVEGSEAAPLP